MSCVINQLKQTPEAGRRGWFGSRASADCSGGETYSYTKFAIPIGGMSANLQRGEEAKGEVLELDIVASLARSLSLSDLLVYM